jgi:carboxypeptidase family protein
MSSTTRLLHVVIFVCLAHASLSWGAQNYQGTVRGSVADATGALIPGATITLTDEDKKTSRETVTDELGNYTFPLVDPGTYTVQVELAGFRRFVQSGLAVSTQQTRTSSSRSASRRMRSRSWPRLLSSTRPTPLPQR